MLPDFSRFLQISSPKILEFGHALALLCISLHVWLEIQVRTIESGVFGSAFFTQLLTKTPDKVGARRMAGFF